MSLETTAHPVSAAATVNRNANGSPIPIRRAATYPESTSAAKEM